MDTSSVVERLRRLKDEVEGLQPYTRLSLEEYITDKVRQLAIERRLQLAAQVCIDIGNYLVAYYGLQTPEIPESIFVILGRENLIPQALGLEMVGIVRFRNILVHGYLEVDPAKVHAVLTNGLSTFLEFAQAIEELLERDEKENGEKAE
ncbi:MAG TPA: DUF86 domain-containing protein [Anaerolineales bacterium]|nr:DUF86 domain-containing protein [Anaerolineales bacterium]